MSLKQKKRKFEPRIKLNHNIYSQAPLIWQAVPYNEHYSYRFVIIILMTCGKQYFSICNFFSPESTTLLRMKCQCLVSGHWLGSISVYDKQHANFMNLLEGFLLCSLEILHSYHLLKISLFMLSHPSPVLYSHNMDPSFIVFLKQSLCYRKYSTDWKQSWGRTISSNSPSLTRWSDHSRWLDNTVRGNKST